MIERAPESKPLTGRPRWIAILVGSAMFMQMLDGTIISTALPAIGRSINENPLKLNLAIACYLLSVAVFVPISGWVADRFGTRRVFAGAIIVFALSSLCCGLSRSLPELLAARIFQGLGGALMVPVGRLILLKMVPKNELVRALSWLSVTALLGFALGPPLGGFIVTYASWRWIFFINLPLGLVGATLVILLVRDTQPEPRRALDGRGFILTGVGLASLVFGFDNLARGMLPSGVIVGLLGLGSACLLIYGKHFRAVRHPIIDLSLLAIPTFLASVVGGAFFRFMTGATPFLLTMLFQLGFGFSPFLAGLLALAHATGTLGMKAFSTRLITAFGFRRLSIAIGIVSALFGESYGLFRPSTPVPVMMLVLLLGGFFSSLQFTSLGALAYADIPKGSMSRATSLTSMGQQLSESIGVGLAAMLVQGAILLRDTTHTVDYPVISPVFMILGGVSLLSMPFFLRLHPDAGAEISNQRRSAPVADLDTVA